MQLHTWFPFIISHHPAKFDGHRPCRIGDIFFICHVTSYDHMVGGSCDIMVEFPSLQVTILPRLVVTGVMKWERGEILFLLCHVTSSEFVIRESRRIMGVFTSS